MPAVFAALMDWPTRPPVDLDLELRDAGPDNTVLASVSKGRSACARTPGPRSPRAASAGPPPPSPPAGR